MGLDLKTVEVRGKGSITPEVLNVRALSVAELNAHLTREAESIKTPPLKRIESRHRLIAAKIASGASTGEIAAEFGMTASRVSVLKSDPTFKELIAYYETKEVDALLVVSGAMTTVLSGALGEMERRIEEEPEAIETDTLLKIIGTMADRTGHAPKRVEEKTVNFSFGDRLEQARARVALTAAPIIEGELTNE
jgi:hypothetical protein